MNDICKERIREKLMEAQKREGLENGEIASILGITPNVVCCAKNTKYWRNFSDVKWEIMQKWCNSGLSLRAYGKNGGHFVPTESVASERFAEEVAKADADLTARMQEHAVAIVKSVPEPTKSVSKPIKSVPKEEVPAPRPSKGQMVDWLLEEKALLQQKIDAIDVLLKCYIS